jgi:hypothetical protein
MKVILFVNHRTKECGVEQLGSRYSRNLKESKKYHVEYIDVDRADEYLDWADRLKPSAVVFNFYSGATMGWLSNELINSKRDQFKQLCIYHELPLEDKGFDLLLHQDPNPSDTFKHWALPRSIPEYNRNLYSSNFYSPEIPTFGSFGFGIGGKGFDTLVRMVNQEYDEARIHLHIPFAAFGDSDGKSAYAHARNARFENVKLGIKLTIDHDFWDEATLLDWLSTNTCNAFLYHEHYGRGIESTTDNALAVKRPLAITKSYQFKHLWSVDDSFTVERNSLRKIIELGTAPTDKFRQLWSREAFVKSFEDALESLGV